MKRERKIELYEGANKIALSQDRVLLFQQSYWDNKKMRSIV